jgi:hypothetical protein
MYVGLSGYKTCLGSTFQRIVIDLFSSSVGDPDVFGPPGSGSISQRHGSGFGSGSRSFAFLIKVGSGLK